MGRARLLRLVAVVAMLTSMLAVVAPATAAPNPSGGNPATWDGDSIPPLFGSTASDDFCAVFGCEFVGPDAGAFDDGAQEVYFPAVGNADESTGLGAAQTSITVQNLSVDDAYIFVYVGMPEDDDGVDLDNWDVVEYAYLSGGASKTFQGSDLEIPAGDVRPVVVVGYNEVSSGEGLYLVPVVLAGVAKQAVTGDSLPFTTAADTAVSGYNAIGGRELGFFDELYFPIVQTNCGPGGCWNSILRISNMGLDDNAAVTVRFFPADDGSGSLQTGFQLQGLVDVGEVWSIDLSEWVPEGWVGSAHVYTDDAVGAIVDRVKPGTDMWITNTASNATSEGTWQVPGGGSYPYVLFAPDVRTDYNGWNTGINVANTVEIDADVSIQYFGSNGNAPAAQTRRLAAHGMTYFYNPSDPSEDRCDQPATDVPGCEFIGGAIILSSNPVAVVVDGVKYFGNDANVGQAFSYSATGNAYDVLAAALVQKGNPANGMGATSGINFMNPNSGAATVETTWLNPSGFGAANFGSSIVWVPGFATGFVYTMFHHNLPNGYVGSAIVVSDLPVVATTANVDYQVNGDGTAIWNLSNPCGFFRQTGECIYESPLEPLDANATLTKEVVVDNPFDDVEGTEALSGVMVTYEGWDENDFYVTGSGFTGANGTATFAVPAGEYSIELVTLPNAPDGYVYTGDMDDSEIFVAANGATTVTNELTLEIAEGTGTLTKRLINVPENYTSMESEVYFCPLDTINACASNAVVIGGFGEDGQATNTVSAEVPAGVYAICMTVTLWIDLDSSGTPGGGEDLAAFGCDTTIPTADPEDTEALIAVLDGQTTVVENDLDAMAQSPLNMLFRDDVTDAPITGAEYCVENIDTGWEYCNTTSTGNPGPYVNGAGTYRITVSHPAYEQESTIITYSPIADLLDGGMNDAGMDSDVVIALDPYTPEGILDVYVTLNGQVFGGIAVNVHFADSQDATGMCAGTIAASGATNNSGEYEVVLPAGFYCVYTNSPIGSPDSIATFPIEVTPHDPNTDADTTHAYTVGP